MKHSSVVLFDCELRKVWYSSTLGDALRAANALKSTLNGVKIEENAVTPISNTVS